MNIAELKDYEEEVFLALGTLLPQLTGRESELDRDRLKALLAFEHSHLLVLREEDGQVAGMLIVACYPILAGGLKAWIEDVVVDERCRGKGYGKALVSYAIEFARECGARSISLTSSPARVAANRLYRTLGFVRRETNVYLRKL